MSDEIEALTSMLGNCGRDQVLLTIEHRELNKKFTLYHQKSEQLIKERDAQIEELTKKCQQLTEDYASFDERFKKKDKECQELNKNMKLAKSHQMELDKLIE